MTCYRPLTGFYSKERTDSGKRKIVFNLNEALTDRGFIPVPCGQCIGCRLEYSRQWAIRCVHEAAQFERNCFITLTYDNKHLPEDLSLNVRDFQLFMKKLRKHYQGHDHVYVVNTTTLEETKAYPIRFYHCGEYGERNKRPHYHACLFNFDFNDKVLWKSNKTKAGVINLYTSKVLSELWPYGFSTVGEVTFESAAYVARYIMKKVKGDDDKNQYRRTFFDPVSGKVITKYVKPEYTTMSRKPGIGKLWYDEFADEVYPDDFVVIRGRDVKPPKYYDACLEKDNPEHFSIIKRARKSLRKKHIDNNTDARLHVREKVKSSVIKTYLKRIVE